MLEPRDMSPQDRRFATQLIFDFSPTNGSSLATVPGFEDPLGIGADSGLMIFGGRVYFRDLLGNFTLPTLHASTDFELPPDTLHGINLLDDVTSMYLSYEGRAFDKSLLNLQSAEIIERNGLPVTSETSPLSLSGFGIVAEKFDPFSVLWSHCPSQDKRERAMAESIKQGRAPCSAPGACMCYGN
jgi:hypothetical protein